MPADNHGAFLFVYNSLFHLSGSKKLIRGRNRKAKQRENKTAIQATALLTGHQAMTGMTIIMMTGVTMICRRKKETGSVEPEDRFYK